MFVITLLHADAYSFLPVLVKVAITVHLLVLSLHSVQPANPGKNTRLLGRTFSLILARVGLAMGECVAMQV